MSSEQPDVGDPDGIAALAEHWHAKSDAVTDALAKLAQVSDLTTSDTWQGVAQTRFTGLLDAVHPSMTGLVTLLDAAGNAFAQYAKAVRRITEDAETIRVQQATLAVEQAVQELAVSSLLGLAESADATEADATALSNAQRARTDSRDRAAALDARWDQLVRDRAAADAGLLRVITGPQTLGRLGTIDRHGVGLHGQELADTLATFSPTELGAYLMLDTQLADRLGEMSPEEAAVFWRTLGGGADTTGDDPSATQDALIGLMPSVVGNLAGLPAWARDRANRITLVSATVQAEQDLADAEEKRAGLGWPASQAADTGIEQARANLDAYRNIEQTLASTKRPGRALVSLDTGHRPPLAAVAVGDIDTADDVTYMVPGMGTTTKGTSGWTIAAQNLWDTQRSKLDGGTSNAVVAWINYETPPVPTGLLTLGVLTGDAARSGAARLAGDLLGFQATRTGHPTLNVVGHSYGTTVAADTLHGKGVHVDSIVSVASAGIEGDIGSAAGIDADRVYAGQGTPGLPTIDPGNNPRDQWAWLGRLGSGRDDPMADSYGATTFGTNGGDPSEGAGVTMHDPVAWGEGAGYFNIGTESLDNIAKATVLDGHGLTAADDAGLSGHNRTLLDNMMGPTL